jgi:hypothetical protein
METPFAKEHRWHEQQARLMEQDCQAERHERFYVPTDEEVAEEAKRRAALRTPPPQPVVDQLERVYLDTLTRDQLTSLAQELYLDANRLRHELDAANGVIR